MSLRKKVTRSSKCIRDQTNRKIVRVQIILTRIDLHTPDTDWQAGEDTKSRGRFGKPRTLIKGSSPPRRTNSLQWSSVELLLRIESTNRTYGEILSINQLVLHSMFCFFEHVSTLRFIKWYIIMPKEFIPELHNMHLPNKTLMRKTGIYNWNIHVITCEVLAQKINQPHCLTKTAAVVCFN